MPANIGFRLKDGATREIDINGIVIAEATEQGLKMVKPLKALPSAAADEVVVQSQVPGVGQTRKGMGGLRFLGSTYVNSGTKSIEMSLYVTLTGTVGAAAGVAIIINGSQRHYSLQAIASNGIALIDLSATILPGDSYSAAATFGSVDSFVWTEIN